MFDFHPQLKQRFAALRTGAEFFSLRYVRCQCARTLPNRRV